MQFPLDPYNYFIPGIIYYFIFVIKLKRELILSDIVLLFHNEQGIGKFRNEKPAIFIDYLILFALSDFYLDFVINVNKQNYSHAECGD